MAHLHELRDGDTHFIVNPFTMEITCASDVKPLRRGDHAAEIYTVEMPRYIECHDMSVCNKVEVHYNNIKYDSSTRQTTTISSFDDVEGFQIAEDDENTVVWAWRVQGDATQLDGTLNFCFRFACLTGETIDYQKFTEIFKSIPVGESIYNTAQVARESADVLEKWRQELLVAIENGGAVKTVNGVAPDKEGNVEIFNESAALDIVAETGLAEPAAADDGSIYVDENDNVYIL